MVPKTCLIAECDRSATRRKMCEPHYRRWMRDNSRESRHTPSTQELFWAKVDKDGPIHPTVPSLGQCWEWTGGKSQGYGVISLPVAKSVRKNCRAHRYSWEMEHGPIGESIFIDHTCFNHGCVNTAHLRPATNKQNLESREGAQKRNTTGVRGVFINRQGRYGARVGHNREQYHVGTFDTLAEAEAAVIAKRNELYTHNLLDRVAA